MINLESNFCKLPVNARVSSIFSVNNSSNISSIRVFSSSLTASDAFAFHSKIISVLSAIKVASKLIISRSNSSCGALDNLVLSRVALAIRRTAPALSAIF